MLAPATPRPPARTVRSQLYNFAPFATPGGPAHRPRRCPALDSERAVENHVTHGVPAYPGAGGCTG